LAERTTGATRQIAQMIQQVQAETKAAVQAMQRGDEEVRAGIALADQAGAALDRIVSGADRTVEMIHQMAAATEEQSATGERITRGVIRITESSRAATGSVDHIVDALAGLNRLTGELGGLIERFHVEP